MNIVNFEKEHIEEAMAIALANYHEERQAVKVLPQLNAVPDLSEFAENGLGVAAFENGKMVGFLGCYRPWDGAFGSTARGTFSPIHAHGTVPENRERIYQRMYQAAAEKWIAQRITYHAIAMYAHDEVALRALFMYGFGARCADAIRPMEDLTCSPLPEMELRALPKEEIAKIREMRKQLSDHMGSSPCFMCSRQQEFDEWLVRAEKRDSVVYVAERNQKSIAFIEVTEDGENFVTEVDSMKNICGAYCLPEYRGTGVFAGLLNYVISQLKAQGVMQLGVDYESINPTAHGAWGKYFTPYTRSIVRRVEECALSSVENQE